MRAQRQPCAIVKTHQGFTFALADKFIALLQARADLRRQGGVAALYRHLAPNRHDPRGKGGQTADEQG